VAELAVAEEPPNGPASGRRKRLQAAEAIAAAGVARSKRRLPPGLLFLEAVQAVSKKLRAMLAAAQRRHQRQNRNEREFVDGWS
jgi:hypothetical protein